jgi:hypothetical protein
LGLRERRDEGQGKHPESGIGGTGHRRSPEAGVPQGYESGGPAR